MRTKRKITGDIIGNFLVNFGTTLIPISTVPIIMYIIASRSIVLLFG